MARIPAIVVALAAIALSLPASASEMYSYVDDDGVIRVTNVAPGARAPARTWRDRAPTSSRPAHATASYDVHLCAAAEHYGVPPPLLKAVVAVESNFDPAATSVKGAVGLMQLMPATARDLDVSDVLDPRQNIRGGARYLRLLHDRFGGDLEKVLAAYNAGPEALRRSGGAIPPFKETRAYVRRVLAARDVFARTSWCGGAAASGS